MNIDLLPFTAFALESSGTAAPSRGEFHTLTLQLALSALHSSHEPMAGSISAKPASAATAHPLRAAVRPADGTPLTITF
jgi:hypothetical protein